MSLDINSTQTQTLFEQLSEAASEWTLFQLIMCIFLSVLCVGTIIGNTVVLYVFARSKRALRSPTHLLLANLAVADLLVGLLVMPILITVTVFDWKWYWGQTACQVADYIHFTLCATSMLSMMAVCLERFVGVKYPLHHKRVLSKKRVFRLSVCIWILAVILTAGPLSVWPIKGLQSPFTCLPNLRPDFVFFISISLYWIPIMVTIYIYRLIYKTSTTPASDLVKWAKRSLGSTVITSTTSVASRRKSEKRRPSKTEEEKYEAARRKQIRLVKKTGVIVAGMFILYAPLFFMFLLLGFKVEWFSRNVLLAAGWLRYGSSFTNTLLYVFAVPYYKKQLLRLMCNERGSSSTNKKSSCASTVKVRDYDSSIDSSMSSSEVETNKLTIKSDPSDSGDSRRYCTSCGNTLRINSRCSICDQEVTVGLLAPPEDWGSAKPFNCPVCTALRFFDGAKPCFCQVCNHKFFPVKPKPDRIVMSQRNSNFLNDCGVGRKSHSSFTGLQLFPNGAPEFSLTEAVASAKEEQLKQLESEGHTVVIQRLRENIIMPLQERRSQILNSAFNSNADDVGDWTSIQELDEIMTKFESDVIAPLTLLKS